MNNLSDKLYGENRKGIEKTCEFCKSTFLTRKGKRGETRRFCSSKCFKQHREHNCQVEIQCSRCKTKFRKATSKLSSSKHGVYFCSRKCKEFTQSMHGDGLGIRPPHYGSGNDSFILNDFYKNNVQNGCKCGEKTKYLMQVHHMDGNRNNNRLDNLEIVCANCHIKRHLTFLNGEWVYSTKALTPRKFLQSLPPLYSTNE